MKVISSPIGCCNHSLREVCP